MVIDYMFGFAGLYQSITGATTLTQVLWGIVFLLAFTIPPFIAFHKTRVKRDSLQDRLNMIHNARPNIAIRGTESVTTTIRNLITGQSLGTPCFTHALFANDPLTQLQAIDAPNVAGHIDVYNKSGVCLYGDVIGRWSETKEEATGGLPAEMEQIMLPANARPFSLDIILKYRGDQECYVHTNAGRKRAPTDWRDKEKELAIGDYLVRVRLRSNNVDKEFWLKLTNQGQGADVSLELLATQPSVVGKAGSQP